MKKMASVKKKKTAAEQGYFGLLDANEEKTKEILAQCPFVFKKLGE